MDIAEEIKKSFSDNTRLDFTEQQLQMFKDCTYDLYKLLKSVYDRPRKYEKQPYNSLIDYKLKRERILNDPSSFYRFNFDNVSVYIVRRRGNVYSVAISGFRADGTVLKAFESLDFKRTEFEKEFTCGIDYYGRFQRSDFNQCADLFLKVVVQFVFIHFDVKYQKIFQQLEFIF